MSQAAPPPDAAIDPQISIQYWNDTPADLTGIMGGYPQLDRVDIQGSSIFLKKALLLGVVKGMSEDAKVKDNKGLIRGVDCGAGIGRITKDLLTNFCSVVDVVEPVKKFTDRITEGEEFEAHRAAGKIGKIYNVGLENWSPEDGTYTIIWNQWCLGHLPDKALVSYLRRCITGLKSPGGIIIVKENLSTTGCDEYDKDDSSVTRQDKKFRQLFREAGLRLVKNEIQRGFPKNLGIYPVMMYALVPE